MSSLLQEVQPEDSAAVGGPADLQDRVHPQQELHPQGHQAGQLPHVNHIKCINKLIKMQSVTLIKRGLL